MRKLFKADPGPVRAEALPRPRSADLRKPAALLKQRVLAAQQQRLPPPASDEWLARKAELLAALRPRGWWGRQGAPSGGGTGGALAWECRAACV
jgi:hypothetical protein